MQMFQQYAVKFPYIKLQLSTLSDIKGSRLATEKNF